MFTFTDLSHYSIKKIKQKLYLPFFITCNCTQCITPQLCHSEQGRSRGGWHKKCVLRRELIRARRLRKQRIITLRRKMFGRTSLGKYNDYIEEEINWIGTLIQLSYKIYMHLTSLGIAANSCIGNVR